MSWDDHARRRAAIKSVLAYAKEHPSAGLPYDLVPEARAQFSSRRELLLALQYDWTQALWARIDLLSLESRDGALLDARKLAERAYAECAERNPVLRRLLDEGRDELGVCVRREEDMLRFA
jgi:hypothetical protein